MYVPKKFIPPSAEAIRTYIAENGFATLTSNKDGKLMATHTPLFLGVKDGTEVLYGHISAGNVQKEALGGDTDIMAVFMENHTYISSSWYDHVNVPTWNYIAVHIYGKATRLNEEESIEMINSLVGKYESNSENAFQTSQMSEKDFRAQMRGIVAFQLSIDRIEASWKLCQNRDDKNYYEIISKLKERGDEMSLHIAKEMEGAR